jgi:hypothetical protein
MDGVPSFEGVSDADAQIRPELIDELIEVYVDWREECIGLRAAYERWSNGAAEQRDLAFAGYRAALDREEQASVAYANQIELVSSSSVPAGSPRASSIS